jgi:heme-degrading monooxygenase HmoA
LLTLFTGWRAPQEKQSRNILNPRSNRKTKGRTVIARVWHGWTKSQDAHGYEAHLRPELLPGLSKVAGFRGSYLLRRKAGEEVEFITIILWDSIEAVKAVAGEDYEKAVIPEERKKYLTRFDAKAAHFEVVAQK